MNYVSMTNISNIARSEGDPKVIQSGPSSLSGVDRLAKGLGWFSIGLGVAELVAANRITRTLGMEGKENLVRACGAREIAHGVLSLSPDKHLGLWSRVAGDGLDIAALMTAMRPDNPKRDNVGMALAAVLGVTVLDVIGAQGVTARHSRGSDSRRRNYLDRSGFPQGVQAAKGAARDFRTPAGMRALPGYGAMSHETVAEGMSEPTGAERASQQSQPGRGAGSQETVAERMSEPTGAERMRQQSQPGRGAGSHETVAERMSQH